MEILQIKNYLNKNLTGTPWKHAILSSNYSLNSSS